MKSKNKIITIVAFVVLAIVIIFGVFGFVSYSGIVPKAKNDISKNIFIEIASVDPVLVSLDETISGTIDKEKIQDSGITTELLDEQIRKLNRVKIEIEKNADWENADPDNIMYLGYATKAVDNRIKMFEIGGKVFENAQTAVEAVQATEDYWDLALKADGCLKEADDYLNNNSQENFGSALDKTHEAKRYLLEAKSKINIIKKSGVKFDLRDYELYIDTKLDACNHAENMCQAIVDTSVEYAQEEYKAYFQKDNLAIQYAKTLESVPAKLIRTRYDLDSKELIDRYKAIRKDTASNDAMIRNYLSFL